MLRHGFVPVLIAILSWPIAAAAEGPRSLAKYFAYPAVEDQFGVIAPWYTGQNGQVDFRIRVAAETLKRYPWADKDVAVMAAPHYVFNGHWSIEPNGTIHVKPSLEDWHNGDVGQRSYSMLAGMASYYRYTGDPAALGMISLTADYVIDYCQTPADHPWPNFFISCPTKGKAYGQANPHGFIQLDLTGLVGSEMVRAYKVTGNARCLEAAKHWADLLAEHCDHTPDHAPWNRYANPEDSKFQNRMTCSIVMVLGLFDDLIRMGYTGKDGSLVKARDTGERYLREVLLPEWSQDPTFGHYFWDWDNPTTTCSIPCFTAQYLMNRREAFPEWKTDVRNILTVVFCRTSVDPGSSGDVYSGAWAFPESSSCCGKSLQYPTMILAPAIARYGVLTDSDWAREIARRQSLLTTYDALESGVVIDGIDGTTVVAGDWFNLAHPFPILCALEAQSWQPELLGASRENHIMRTTSVVQSVCYSEDGFIYSTYDAPAGTEDVLRLAFQPKSIVADGQFLPLKEQLTGNGYTLQGLPDGDWLVTVRHDGSRHITVAGDDPRELIEDDRCEFEGDWTPVDSSGASDETLHVASQSGAAASCTFEGNQVRLLGRVTPNGGKAKVLLDGVEQLCGIDFWCPQSRDQQVVFYRSGLAQGKHTLKVAVTGEKNPVSGGTQVCLDVLQCSSAQPKAKLDFGAGRGPDEAQRVIFGYVGRKDYVDSQGHAWRPATELILRLKALADLVPVSFWTEPRTHEVANTEDPELYRYGVFGRDFTAYFTVSPKQTYSVRVKLCQTDKPSTPGEYATSIDLQGKTVANGLDVAAKAGGLGKAADLVFNDVRPEHGVIALRFWHPSGRAMVQAVEIVPGSNETR